MLFEGLEVAWPMGSIVRLAGANGVGKTSLMRILAGVAPPLTGSVCWGEAVVAGAGVDEAARQRWRESVLYLGHALAAHELLTPLENLAFVEALAGRTVSRQCLSEALAAVGLAAQRRLPLKVLSAGQRRRVGLARLPLAADRPVWLLDEPFTALDVGFVATLANWIDAHVAAGGLVVLITHQDVPFRAPVLTLDVAAFSPERRQVAA